MARWGNCCVWPSDGPTGQRISTSSRRFGIMRRWSHRFSRKETIRQQTTASLPRAKTCSATLRLRETGSAFNTTFHCSAVSRCCRKLPLLLRRYEVKHGASLHPVRTSQEFAMRAPAIPPAEIGADLQPLYDDMRQGIERSFKDFVAIRPDGALVGPWAPWLRHAKFGK